MKSFSIVTSICILCLSLLIGIESFSQTKEISFGVGPTVSLWYWSGGPTSNWGSVNFDNLKNKRKNLGTSFSFQYSKKIKKELNYFIGLSYDSYGIKFQNSFRTDSFLIDVDTRESLKTIFLSVGVEKNISLDKWDLQFGIGLYTFLYFIQQIDLAPYFDYITNRGYYKLSITNRSGNEAGAQVGFRLSYPFNKYMRVGIQPIFFYTLSAWGSEKISANLYWSVKF